MESKDEKIQRYYAYLKKKREIYIHNLTRIGAKLMNLHEGDYNLEGYIKEFVPPLPFLKRKIEDEVRESQISLVEDPTSQANGLTDFDSRFIEAIKEQIVDLEEDFLKLNESTDCDKQTEPVTRKQRIDEEPERLAQPKATAKEQAPNTAQANDFTCNSHHAHHLAQVINPGEMSKIFVQKSRIEVVRSMPNKPDFDDDNIETIFIYRSKK